ncbi:unnamed protein product [Cuscuta europaea]|nr:unnamed protein product [Cuscuta europaea]
MRSLPSAWKPKTMAIEEVKDLSTMTVEDLRGSLMTYELELQEEHDAKNVRNERGIALNAREEEEESESESEDEMSLFMKQFGKMYRRYKGNKKNKVKRTLNLLITTVVLFVVPLNTGQRTAHKRRMIKPMVRTRKVPTGGLVKTKGSIEI